MELSSSNIESKPFFLKRKLLFYFLKKKHFLYFQEWSPALFSRSLKNKRNRPRENFLYFRKRRLRKDFLCFLKRKLFLYFGKREPGIIFLYFRKWNFQSSKNEKDPLLKCFSYFRKLNFSTPSLKNSYFF